MKKTISQNFQFIKFVWMLLLIAGFSGAAFGATFTVTKTADTNDGVCDADCSLREAIATANTLAGDDTISFAITFPDTISLTLGQILVTSNINVVGSGARNLTIQRSTAAGTSSFRIFSVVKLDSSIPNITVSISGITIANGESPAASSGGGITNSSNCILNLTDVVIKDNKAIEAPGGGIRNNGRLNINRSSIINNSASQGGGLSNQPGSITEINNSTISNNTAIGVTSTNTPGAGGGLNNFSQLLLNNVTISNNTASQLNGGVSTTSSVDLRNTIIAANIAPICKDAIGGTFNSLGNNLIGENNCVSDIFPVGNPNAKGDKVGTADAPLNPLLGPLQNNGGQTDTRALLLGSPALNSGNNCVIDDSCTSNNPSTFLTNDQRGPGFLRQVGNFIDIGALERQANETVSNDFFDFDGDGKSDLSVFRPSNGIWYLNQSQNGFGGIQFGASGDRLVPADYDGDGKTDVAVYRNGNWYIQGSTSGFTGVQFGESTDIPASADFDADGKSDLAVYRPSSGTWYVQRSSLGFFAVQFGQTADKPVAADFDGDGKADFAVFRPSTGIWYVQQSTAGFNSIQFGAAEDKLVVADYDGDGKADFAVFRPSNGFWYLNRSQLGFTGIQFGASGDVPVPADYDGDGKADIAVYRNDTWFIQRSTQGFTGVQFGSSGDLPAPNAFVR